MAGIKNSEKISEWFSRCFSKHIFKFLYFLLAVFFLILFIVYTLDKKGCANGWIICFLDKWGTTFLTASVCVWGFTLTCAIFLMGRLDEIYYGTSLKRIIVMCFGKFAVVAYITIYILLIPLIILTYYERMWLTNSWFQIVNYGYSAGLIVFITVISLRANVIELIRDRTVKQVKKKHFSQNLYNDEQLHVLNMIRNLDYDDMWQSNKLRSIIVDMVMAAIDKDRLYIIYNVIYLIIQSSGYQTEEQKNRTINVLGNIIADIMKKGKERSVDSERLEEAIVEVIVPILQVNVEEKSGKWISQLIGFLPWGIQKRVTVLLLFGAEYLYECEVFCLLTVDELIDTYFKLDLTEISDEEKETLKKAGRKHWSNWNLLNNQNMKNTRICEAFFKDYENIDKRVCRTEILLALQVRKLENEYYQGTEII